MRLALLLALLGLASPALAQAPDAARADAKVPPVRYESAFEKYRPHSEPELRPWREVNDEVGKAGGHIGIFRAEQRQAKPAPKPSPQKADHAH